MAARAHTRARMATRRFSIGPWLAGATLGLAIGMKLDVAGELEQPIGDDPALCGRIRVEPHTQRVVSEAVAETAWPVDVNVRCRPTPDGRELHRHMPRVVLYRHVDRKSVAHRASVGLEGICEPMLACLPLEEHLRGDVIDQGSRRHDPWELVLLPGAVNGTVAAAAT